MATERVLSNLNLISFKTEGGLQNHIDELQDGDLAFTPDNSLKGVLFDFKWADHLLNDMSWLRADTFSWQSGDVYVAAYNHLVADFEGTTAETETIGDITITFYRAEDGHKICLPDQEDKVLALYNATGVAWYYILDTTNKQFKLPRTKYGFTGLRDEVGGYVSESLPNITGEVTGDKGASGPKGTGAMYVIGKSGEGIYGSGGGQYFDFGIDASLSSSTYQDGAPVQERATQMYLYFYVGNFERDAVEQTAGITTETLNGKADSDLGNIPANYDYVVESQMPTEANGYTWYRKYKSGWVEQGGLTPSGSGAGTVTLPVVMANNNYQFLGNVKNSTYDNVAFTLQARTLTTTTAGYFKSYNGGASGEIFWWQVSGMSAQ